MQDLRRMYYNLAAQSAVHTPATGITQDMENVDPIPDLWFKICVLTF